MMKQEFDLLVGPLLPWLFRLAYRLTNHRQDAEDLLQSVLLKIYPQMRELQHIDQLKPWLGKVLYHEFIDGQRRQKRWLQLLDPQAPRNPAAPDVESLMPGTEAEAPDRQLENRQCHERIIQAMSTLSSEQRALIVLHDMEGYTMEELALTLDIPTGTVKSRLHRARQRLRLCLAGEPFSEPYV